MIDWSLNLALCKLPNHDFKRVLNQKTLAKFLMFEQLVDWVVGRVIDWLNDWIDCILIEAYNWLNQLVMLTEWLTDRRTDWLNRFIDWSLTWTPYSESFTVCCYFTKRLNWLTYSITNYFSILFKNILDALDLLNNKKRRILQRVDSKFVYIFQTYIGLYSISVLCDTTECWWSISVRF